MTPMVSSTLLRTQSDARLLGLARQGQERAFEAIVERYRKPLIRFCRRFLPEPRAEDAVQQTFLNAWSSLRRGTEVADVRPWLYRIARNAALDSVQRAGYDYAELTEALELSPAPEGELERRWVMRETLSGVAALPANQREALLRTAVEGHSRAEIARDLQISEGAVRQLVHRARLTLRATASAVTPMPVVSWAASLGSPDAPLSARIAELAAGGGAAGGAGLLVKTGTVVVAAGALAVGTGSQIERSSPPAKAAVAPGAAPATPERARSTAAVRARSHAASRRGAAVTGRAREHGFVGRPDESVLGRPAPTTIGQRHAPSIVITPSHTVGGRADGEGSGTPGSGDVSDGGGSRSGDSGPSGSGSSGSGSSGPGSGDGGDHSGSGSGDSGSDGGQSGSGSGDSGSGDSGSGDGGHSGSGGGDASADLDKSRSGSGDSGGSGGQGSRDSG